MKRLALQFVALLVTATAAAAEEAAPGDPMAAFYGNTLTIAVPDAYYYARRFVEPDGTWREPRGSGEIRGAWERMPDRSTCHWQTEPAIHNPTRYCYPPETRRVGEEWTTTDPNTGNLAIQKIEPGRN
ncbi:MAG: hypothetical protein ACOY5Y_03210 [Pseudomonadota bacterium]